jgi:uncharacterized protein involved in type VI secretion and phage assembly
MPDREVNTDPTTPTTANLILRVREQLAGLRPGETAEFDRPQGQPAARIRSQKINAVAYALWGSGRYRMWSAGTKVTVAYVDGRKVATGCFSLEDFQ